MVHETNRRNQSNRSTVTADDHGKDWTATDEARRTKEDAISARTFERLVESTYEMDDDYFAMECRLVLFCCGRLGMRPGEVAHMTEGWINRDEQYIEIPSHEPCTNGRSGGICGHCRGAARQMARVRTENSLDQHYRKLSDGDDAALEPGRDTHSYIVDPERFHNQMWSPKTKNAAREIPYARASTRASLVIEDYFDRYEQFEGSRGSVNRRVDRMAEQADGIKPDEIYPHALRSTAATYFSNRGLSAIDMKALFGWSEFSTAISYIEDSPRQLETSLFQVRS
jgi:integrase